MKKLNLMAILFGLFTIGFLASCGTEDPADELPLLTTNPSSDVSAVEGTLVTIAITAGENPTSKSELKTLDIDANGISEDTLITFPNNTTTYPGTFSFPAPAAGTTNTVTFILTDKAGKVNSKTIVITGTSSTVNTPFGTEITDAFFHVGGSLQGAYDLVNETTVAAAGAETTKDMKNTDVAGTTFTGSWTTGTGNGTTFVKDNSFDYANGSVEEATAAYAGGSWTTMVANPAAGDIFIAELRDGNGYAVIEIVSVDPTNNDCACGNTGKITFKFKKS